LENNGDLAPENTNLASSSPSGPGRNRWHPKGRRPPFPAGGGGPAGRLELLAAWARYNEDDVFNLVRSSSAEGLFVFPFPGCEHHTKKARSIKKKAGRGKEGGWE
jgi:hypothetical protein